MAIRAAQVSRVGAGLLDALAVLAPVRCAGCGAPDRAVCAGCRAELAPRPHRVERFGIPIVAALEYGGVAASVITAFKDAGRTDAAPALAPALRAAVAAALAEHAGGRSDVELCAVPSTRAAYRRRGYAPVERLLAAAGFSAARMLRADPSRGDQAELGVAARRRNASGSFRARHPLDGRRVVLVDDIATTGATALDARRALLAAGAEVLAVAVLAQTPRRYPRGSGRSSDDP